MNRDEAVSVVILLVLGLALPIGALTRLWSMTSVLEYMPYFIMTAMVGVFLWGFRERIDEFVNPVKLVVTEPDWGQPVTELHVRFQEGGERICKGQFYFVKLTNQGRRSIEELHLFAGDAWVRIVLLTDDPTTRHCITTDYNKPRRIFESELASDGKMAFHYALVRRIDSNRALDWIEELRPGNKNGITFLLAFAFEDDKVVWLPTDTKRYYNIPCTFRILLECSGKKVWRFPLAIFEVTTRPGRFNVRRLEQTDVAL
jgi:hypothetical protein